MSVDRGSEYAVSATAPAPSASVLSLQDAWARNRISGTSACQNEAHGDDRTPPTKALQTI